MPRAFKYPRTNFSAGLLNPAAEGKISNAILEASLRQADNCRLDKNGNITSAPGTEFKADLNALTEKDGPFAKVEFKVSNELSYTLVLADEIIYVKKAGEYLKDEDGNFITIFSPYKAEDLFNEEGVLRIQYVQSADVLYLAHENYNLHKIMRRGETDWAIAQVEFKNGPWGKINEDKNILLNASDIEGIVDLKSRTGENPIIKDWHITSYKSGWDTFTLRIYIGGHNGAGEKIYGIAEASASSMTGSWAEYVANILNTFPQFKATNPTRTTLTLEAISNQSEYSGKQICVYIETWFPQGRHYWVYNNWEFSTIQTSADIFKPEDVGRYIRLFESPDYVITAWRAGLGNVIANSTVCTYGNNEYLALTGGSTGLIPPTHTEGSRSDGQIVWKYLNSSSGWGQIIEYIDPTHVKLKVLSSSLPQGLKETNGTYLFQWDIGKETHPVCLAFYKDRLFLGINDTSGPIIAASNSGDYENFDDLEYGEQLATSALSFTPQLGLNKLLWFKNVNDILFVGTAGALLAVQPLNPSDVLGPNNITYKPVAFIPCSEVPPIVFETLLLFIEASKTKIFSVQYSYDLQAFTPAEVSANCDYFLKDKIISWNILYTPDKNILAVTGAGEVVELRLISAEFISLVKYKTNKRFKQVISLFDSALNKDKAGFVSFAGGKWLDEESGQNQLEMSVKAQLDFNENGKAIGTLAPEVLRGRTLFLIVDGKAYGPFTPGENGNIDLSGFNIEAEQNAYCAYLGFFSPAVIEFMPVTGGGQSPQIAGAAGQRIVSVTARVWQSKKFKFGRDLKELWPAAALEEDYPKNGDIVLDVSGSTSYPAASEGGPVNSTGARFFIVQDSPLDFCICSLFYDISISEG